MTLAECKNMRVNVKESIKNFEFWVVCNLRYRTTTYLMFNIHSFIVIILHVGNDLCEVVEEARVSEEDGIRRVWLLCFDYAYIVAFDAFAHLFYLRKHSFNFMY